MILRRADRLTPGRSIRINAEHLFWRVVERVEVHEDLVRLRLDGIWDPREVVLFADDLVELDIAHDPARP